MQPPIKVTHLILRLDTGGAEKSLYRLVRHSPATLEHRVICLGPRSSIGDDIQNLGVSISWFNYRSLGPVALWRAWRELKVNPPDVLQGWMYFGNLLVSLLALLLPGGGTKVAWNIRASLEDLSKENAPTRWAIKLAAWRALLPELVIYNSYAGVESHARFGFNRRHYVVIPNGIDTTEFKPDAAARARVRARYGVADAVWVGMISRYHASKRVDLFLKAVRRVLDQSVAARFVLAGPGMDSANVALLEMIQGCGLTEADLTLAGPITDTAEFLPALDLLVIASDREGTPNVLLEAMACGVSVVATRVGDVPKILTDETHLAHPGDVDDLAAKLLNVLGSLPASESQLAAQRQFVQQNYADRGCMAAYAEHYQSLMARTGDAV